MLLWWRHSLLLGIAYSIRKPLIALETVGFNQLIFPIADSVLKYIS